MLVMCSRRLEMMRVCGALVLGLVLVLAVLAGGLQASEAPAAVLQDFETGYTPSRWGDAKGEVGLSTDWHADGTHSVRIDPGLSATVEQFRRVDWSHYTTLRLHIKYEGTTPGQLGIELVDTIGTRNYWNRYLNTVALTPGEQVIDIDYAGGLYRGEPTSKYRGPAKTPVDLTQLRRMAFSNPNPARLYLDRIEVVQVKPLTTPGGWAFHFCGPRSTIPSSFLGVTPQLQYAPSRHYGLLGEGWALSTGMTWPTVLLGEGVAWPERGFQVDLSGGEYVGLIAFERGGYWGGDEGCAYDHAALRVNGTTIAEHDFGQGAIPFRFEDTEITDLSQVADRLVWPASGVTRIAFRAVAGANVFTLQVTHATASPLRVAGLILAPATAAGRAFIDAHEDRQRRLITTTFAPLDKGRRQGRSAPHDPLVVETLPPGAEVYPRDWPGAPGTPPGEVIAVRGQTVCVHLGVYASQQATIAVAAPPLVMGGTPLTDAHVAYGRYLPDREQTGSMWLAINHYRPESTFTVGPELSRSLIVEYVIPDHARSGLATTTITLTGAGAPLVVPIQVRVLPVTLVTLPIPVGIFANTPAVDPRAMDQAAWWKLEESAVRLQMTAGLTALTGGEGIRYRIAGGTIDGSTGLALIRLAQRYGPILAIINYGGFYPTPQDPSRFAAALQAFVQQEHLPPHFVSCYDEPSTDEALAAALPRTTACTVAGLHTIGWTSEAWKHPAWVSLMKVTDAPAANLHDRAWFGKITALGHHPWVYNNGNSRYATGLELWRMIRLGCEGRLDWIGFNTQGFAFNNLDGREPANALFAAHDRFGVLETPAWLSRREGLLDCRLRLSLEQVAPKDDPVLALWTLDGYRTDEREWNDTRLTAVRTRMLERLEELSRKP